MVRGESQGEVLSPTGPSVAGAGGSVAYVLGSPIAHSLSPVLHRAAYSWLGLSQWSYAAREVDEAAFAGFVAGCGPEVRGLSLTMPLKEIAFTVATTVTDRARLAGAINTLVRTPDGWAGDNTDIVGIVAALRPPDQGAKRSHRSGLIVGAGATARSALIALAELGCDRVTAAARRPSAALDSLAGLADTLNLQLTVRDLDCWREAAAGYVVSTVPRDGGAVAADMLSSSGVDLTGVRMLDVVYADWPTPLARAAEAAGATVVSGLDMLVHQGVEQVELMTGRRPDPAVLLAAGQAAVAAR